MSAQPPSDDAVRYHHEANRIADRLHRLAHNRGHARCFVLLDPTLRNALDDHRFESWAAAKDARSIQVGQIDRTHCPILVRIDLGNAIDDSALHTLIQMAVEDWHLDALRSGHGHRVCAWLLPNLELRELAHRLAGVTIARRPGGAAAFLRFYDPLVQDVFWRLCSSSQRSWFLQGIDHWMRLDRWGELVEESTLPLESGATSHPFDHYQWRALDCIRAINEAWLRCADEGHGAPSADVIARVVAAMVRSANYDLHDHRDLEAFAFHAFTVAPEFDRHPLLQARLRGRPATESYGRWVAPLSADEWNTIRAASVTATSDTRTRP